MPVAAGVVDVALFATRIALAQLAPERGGAATLDCAERPVLNGTEPMRGAKRRAVPANDVGQFDPSGARAPCWRGHGALPGGGVGSLQEFQRRGRARQVLARQVKVARAAS